MKKPFKPNAADFLFHKFSVAKQPKERSLSKVESEIRMRILGLESWQTHGTRDRSDASKSLPPQTGFHHTCDTCLLD